MILKKPNHCSGASASGACLIDCRNLDIIMLNKMNQKILIIEDDKFFREIISKKLQKENFDVATASDGKEALAYLESHIPDLIVLDLILPGLDGYDILSIIKKDKRIMAVPVIGLSNLGQQEEIDKAKSLGAIDFMVKVNFTLEEIVGRVKHALFGLRQG